MSFIEINIQQPPVVELVTGTEYNIVVQQPAKAMIEVNGLFPSTFISQDIDGGVIF